jgi:hypothetical protein
MTDKNLTAEEQVNLWLHKIIDEVHPLFTAISDERHVLDSDTFGIFTRDFLHKNGKKFRMAWRVYYGTPETVRTVFEPAIQI